jgi:hypothetical protein
VSTSLCPDSRWECARVDRIPQWEGEETKCYSDTESDGSRDWYIRTPKNASSIRWCAIPSQTSCHTASLCPSSHPPESKPIAFPKAKFRRTYSALDQREDFVCIFFRVRIQLAIGAVAEDHRGVEFSNLDRELGRNEPSAQVPRRRKRVIRFRPSSSTIQNHRRAREPTNICLWAPDVLNS